MEQVGKLKLYSSEEVLDKHFGKLSVSTPHTSTIEKYHSSRSSSHAVRTFLSSNNCILCLCVI